MRIAKFDKRLYELSMLYIQKTEAFDKSLCRAVDNHGNAKPVLPDEVSMCTRNAKNVMSEIIAIAEDEGYDKEEIRQAIKFFQKEEAGRQFLAAHS